LREPPASFLKIQAPGAGGGARPGRGADHRGRHHHGDSAERSGQRGRARRHRQRGHQELWLTQTIKKDYHVTDVHADRTAFCGLTGERIVEPGEIQVAVGGSSDRLPLRGSFTLTGPRRVAGPGRVLDTQVSVGP
jgi:hypothetical protein